MRTKILISVALLWGLVSTAQKGARVGYIDMDYILENVPEYAEASVELDKRVEKWRQEVELKLSEIEDEKTALANEKVLLTKELIEEREEDIYYKEKEILDYQHNRFGPGGDLIRYKQTLIQPVQDQVFNAIQEIAKLKKFDFVFDKSSDEAMLFTADRYDISDLVLRNITRASKRKQVSSKAEKSRIEREEKNTVAQDRELQERQKVIDAKKAEREALIEKKRNEREDLRQKKIAEYEARRKELLEIRKRKKDSLEALKNKK